MDARGRQGINSVGAPSAASVMPPYYGGGNSASDANNSYDRFWTQSNSVGPLAPDPWAPNAYTQPLLPPPASAQGRVTPNYSPASHHNNSPPNSGSFNIPPHSSYPPRIPPTNGINGNNVDLGSFSGPSPPNTLQPISYGVSQSQNSSNSPRSNRQYTPSTTPSPHVISQPHQPSPINGINGNSSHSSHESSPPNSAIANTNNFEGYMNGTGIEMNSSKANGPIDHQHSDMPGYLSTHSRQNLQNVSRYSNDPKASDGELMQQQYQHSYYQNYATSYGEQQSITPYYDSYGQNRRPFDPYQPYPNSNQASFNESASDAYNSAPGEYNAMRPNSEENTANAIGNNGQRRDSISSLEQLSVEKITKIDSMQQGKNGAGGSSSAQQRHSRTNSYDDDANFDTVLHNNDHGLSNNYGQSDRQFGVLPNSAEENGSVSFQPPPSSTYTNMENQNHQSSEHSGTKFSPKSDESNLTNNNSNKPPAKKRERKKKGRSSSSSSSSATNNNNNSHDDPKSKGNGNNNKEKSSFLGCGHPQSPLNSNSNSSQSSSSNQSRQNQPSNIIKIEGTNESNQASSFSEGGGEKSPNDNSSSGNNSSGGAYEPIIKLSASTKNSSEGNTNVPSTPKSKKKPWKKAKQINSEQLLEERERNCAEYIENSMKENKGKNPVVVKSEFDHQREERNITIDHQKEQQIYEQTFGKLSASYNSDKDNENSSQSIATTGEADEKKDVPLVECGCFPVDAQHPEPGPFYTHLGAAHTLPELRELLEMKTGFRGGQLRFEKVIYTGKEGKTSQGCPLAKWIIRRGSYEEQLLFLVKHRKGHKCATAWIVVCCVIWEAVPPHFADNLYDTIVYKLNRFGIPTTRRSDTNEQRSCACQGVDPDTCGAAYSFGCAWSMFFNGCKYARSRNVRKFRLTEEHEEAELEEKIQHLATHLAPLYERVAADSYRNQIEHENEGLECRLGYRPGRPFSGVTACIDYCSHAHKDAHNMINGCTVTVAFTRNRTLTKGDDEQFHVLPLYKLDDTDEFGSKEGQKQKVRKGQLEILKKFPTKVRIRKVPLLPSRRRGKPKPPSSNSSHSLHPQPPKPCDLYSSDLSSLSMPPNPKREKMSVFEELNGPSGGSDLFDSRFPHGPTPPHFSNLLMTKSHSKLGMGMGLPMSIEDHVQSCQISSTVLDSDGCPQTIWNPSPYGQLPQTGQSSGSSFRSYFDTPLPPTSQYSTPSASQFSHNLDFLNSSSRGTGNSTANIGNSNSNSLMNSSVNSNPANPQNTSSMTTPGYTSMSPSILPSFRHTFMTEAESLSMLSSMSPAGTGSPSVVDSTSNPRGGKPPTSQQLNLSTSSASNNTTPIASFSHHSDNLGLSNTPSYFSSSTSIVPPNPYSNSTNSSLYHPHPHHPSPTSCLSSAPNQVGVPFNSSSSYANSSSSFVPPPASMDPHHTFGMGMNMNPIPSWNPINAPSYSHHGYGAVPQASQPGPSYHPHNQMSSLGMNSVTPSAFPHMNQYNPYGNQSNFISPHAAAMHSHHPTNPWAAPLPSFMSGPHGHPPPPAPSCFVAPPKPKVIPEVNESLSDNEDAFKDSNLGGVGIALTHGSVILQCAKHEMHATTSLKNPNRMYPSRICLVFYQHKSMNNRFHGWSEWEKKIEAKKLQEVKLINQGKLEASPRKMKQLIKEGYLADTP